MSQQRKRNRQNTTVEHRKRLRAGDTNDEVTALTDDSKPRVFDIPINQYPEPLESDNRSLTASTSLKALNVNLSQCLVPEIKGGEVYYIRNFVPEETAAHWLSELSKTVPWYHPKLKVYGKEVSQSRSIAGYATGEEITVKYSGHVIEMHYDYPTLLSEIQGKVEDFLGERFNHVMLNRYENGKEYIGRHRDTRENKIIASLSLGAERTFIMTPDKPNPSAKPHKWILGNGSLLIMQGQTQDKWKHEIPREPKIAGERISLTFRQLCTP